MAEKLLDGRVAIVTGAGRGLGREHALLLAAEGADVVLNDIAAAASDAQVGPTALELVAQEIKRARGSVAIHTGDVADYDTARELIAQCIERFGRLDILVNNAGILRDASITKMSARDWDDVVRVDLLGHFAPTQQAAAWWREQAKSGAAAQASVINTASGSGLFGNFGQANYAAAKAGVAALTLTAAMELQAYGVRVNAIAPIARTAAALGAPAVAGVVGRKQEGPEFDAWDPANVAPLVVYLSRADCAVTGGVFHIGGNELALLHGWALGEIVRSPEGGRWTNEALAEAVRTVVSGSGPIASQQSTLAESMAGLIAVTEKL